MTDIVIVSAARTPIATAYKGSLAGVDAFALSEVAMGAAVERSGVPTELIEDIGWGESFQGGGNVGRYAANQIGLTNVPGVATQRWCASGMAGTQWIAANIAARPRPSSACTTLPSHASWRVTPSSRARAAFARSMRRGKSIAQLWGGVYGQWL